MKSTAESEKKDELAASGLCDAFFLAAKDFAAMQQEHRTALACGACKDIFSWRERREHAFRGLVRIVEKMVAGDGRNIRHGVRARDIMEKLLAEEDLLQELVMARQLEVQEQLLAMRKGKEALQGYNMNKGLVPRPRYLSSRM